MFTLVLGRAICLSVLFALADALHPYCDVNETSVSYTPVMKTRTVVKKPSGMFKFMKKTKMYTEEYEAQEEHIKWKLISGCCEGYEMSELKICEPVCANGCPKEATCVEPNRCQCRKGYISAASPVDGQHYCEPICDLGCPEHGRCAAPNMCECERGYHAHQQLCLPHCSSGCPHDGVCTGPELCSCTLGYKAATGTCVPICERGDGCRHGKCVDTEQCVCNGGFVKNASTEICEPLPCEGSDCASEPTTTVASAEATTADAEQFEMPTGAFSDDLDEEEKIFFSTPAYFGDESDASTEHADGAKCPNGFRHYHGECRAEIFASNEADCRFKPCTANAICLENGTCACDVDYTWHKQLNTDGQTATTENSFIEDEMELLCLSLVEIEKFLENFDASEEITTMGGWLSTFLIVLGLTCIVSAAVFLAVKLLRRKRGKMDVEAKNDLCCEYENNCFTDNQMVL